MAILDVNWNPSRRDLRIFAALQPIFWGAIAWKFWDTPALANGLIVLGVTLGLLGLASEKLCRWLYIGWMYAFFPLGWVISHLVMGIVFYLVLTPIGLVMRLAGHSPIPPGFDRQASSYWTQRPPSPPPERYFRQF